MVSKRIGRIAFALVTFAFVATSAFAQSSVFTFKFERFGPPRTEIQEVLNPATGLVELVPVQVGAFVNPCTSELVDVFATTTLTTNQTVDNKGNTKLDINVVTKGTGTGWNPGPNGEVVLSGATYIFSDTQNFNVKFATGTPLFESEFTDRMVLRGAKSVDNWTIRARFRVRVGADGVVKIEPIEIVRDTCKG
jgi:hypothetical protein